MKIGFVSMPLTGHLNPMTALARRLQSRGNEVVFFGVRDAQPIVHAAGLDFVSICEQEYPLGSVAKEYGHLATLRGEDVVRYSARELHPRRLRATFEHLPEKLAAAGVEAVVIDIVHFFVELVPMSMGLPYVHIWNILHIDRSGATPPCFFSWPHETTSEARARNMEGVIRMSALFAPIAAVARDFAAKKGLQIDWSQPSATISKLAVITQTPEEFDFPGSAWPPQFHYTGPFQDEGGRAPIPFPWDKLTGEPLIYASMGTLVNGLEHVYRSILQAARKLPATQLVLSVGNNIRVDDLGPVPSNAIVVPKAPQVDLLKHAALCITHAGVNTTLEALAQGVPMVAIPIGFDQPGVAARIAYHGVGEFVEEADLTAKRLLQLIRTVVDNPAYREKARYFQKVIAQVQGLDLAANLIERAFSKSQRSAETSNVA